MEVNGKKHIGLLDVKSTWIRILYLILLCILSVDTNGRCGCSTNRVIGNGFYNPEINAVRGDPYQVSSGSFGALDSSEGSRQNLPIYKILQFQPTYLDFFEQSVGMPIVRTVTVVNPSSTNKIQLLSVAIEAPHFHASAIKSKNLEPLTNTTFELVFLPRVVGNVENTIFLHTNRGVFPFQVFGVGLPNVYRLRSYIGARIPTDGTFSPYINMYNPYGEPIQVTEMYSSGGDLHLELPADNIDEAQRVWEIPPYETKPIMKATFSGKVEGNHTSFVRIKIGRTPAQKDVLILPFAVEITSMPGIYTNIDVFDFGTLRTMDEPKSLNLNMINTGNRSVPISSIIVHPPNKALSIQFSPLVLKPSKKYSRVGIITYTALHVTNKRQQSGSIIVQTGEKVRGRKDIQYQANVLQGTLAYSVGKTAFYSGNPSAKSISQPLTITNTFNFSLIIYNGSLPSDFSHIFSIVNFTSPTIVRPGKLISPLSIRYKNSQPDLVLSTVLRLYTNASIFTIPVHSYTGKLKYTVDGPDEDSIDYGTVGVRENRSITFKIINKNPVEVSIKEYSCCGNIEFARLRLDFIRQGRRNKQVKRSKWITERNNATHNQSSILNEQLTLKPREEATFSVDVTSPPREGAYHGEVTFKTTHEEVHIPIYIKTVVGSLISKPKRIHFQNSFPGQTKSHTVFLESSFSSPLKISDIKLQPPDERLVYIQTEKNVTELLPNRRTKIGWLRMNPSRGSDAQCYLCLCHTQDENCADWILSLSLPGETWELDLKLLEKMKGKWEALKEAKQAKINSSLIVKSEILKNFSVPVQASLTWPSLVEQSVRFPPTHIENYTQQELVLTNPSDVPVLVQVLPLLQYPHPQGAMDIVSDRLEEDSFSIELNGHSAFSLADVSGNSHERSLLHSKFGIIPAPNTVSLLLKRRSKAVVNIGFKPDDDKLKTSIMVVRNNLTILELVVIQGQGARGQLTINDKKSSLDSLLLFELKSNHLSDCNKSTAKARTFPSFTVKRSFTAKNIGQLLLHISSMNINGYECNGYGFRILNCGPFTLQPNESRKLDITFTPDFTMSRLVRTLRLISSMNTALEFTLLATLPHHLLSLCASSLPRPFWEPYLHIIAALVMSIVFFVVIFGAYIDAQKYVLQCTFGSPYSGAVKVGRVSEIYTPGTVFNLNSIVGPKSKTPEKKDSSDLKAMGKSNGLHLTLQKRPSCEATPLIASRSRSSSFCSTTSETSLKSATSTPSSETIMEVPNEPEKKDNYTDNKKAKKKDLGSIENMVSNIAIIYEKGKNKENEAHKHGKHRKSDKDAKIRRQNTDIRVYEESASNVVIQEFSILEPGINRTNVTKQKKKVKSVQRKEPKETKKQQQQPIVYESQPSMKLRDFELVESIPNDSSFTKVESKAQKFLRKGNKVEPAPFNNNLGYSGSLDRLDEIQISGPKPDMRDSGKGHKVEALSRTKSDHSKRTEPPPRRRSLQHNTQPGAKVIYDSNGKLITDIPTSPHAIAAAVVEAALEKSIGSKNKKSKAKLEKASSAGSTPTSLESLSESSRSSSYSSIVSNDNPIKLLGSNQGQNSSLSRGTPSPLPRDDSRSSSGHSSPINKQCRSPTEPESWSAYIRRLAVGIHPGRETKSESKPKPPAVPHTDTQTSNSMFYYDNLSSLRATKKPMMDEFEQLRKAPGTRLWPMKDRVNKTELDPASKEFVPKSMRRSKAAFFNGSVSSKWPENRKTGVIQPPPGLTRSNRISDIWGIDNSSLSSGNSDRRGWDSFKDDTFKDELTAKLRHRTFHSDRYSVLMPQPTTSKPNRADLFEPQYNAFGHPSAAEAVNNPWSGDSAINELNRTDGSWATPSIRPSIWSNSRGYSADDSQISRSLLGLDLSVPDCRSCKDKAVSHSPVDPLSVIWDPSDDSIDIPYEGWSEDIKEE